MKLTTLALKRPVTTMMFFLCFVVTGLIGSRLLPLEYFPSISFPGIIVSIPYPNSSAEQVEEVITRPVEEVLSTMSALRMINSTTSDNRVEIFMQFAWSENPRLKSVEAREKIDAIRDQLPDDLQRFFIVSFTTDNQPMMTLRVSSERDLSNAYDLLDRKLKRPIERIDGVSKVTLYGVDKRQVRIQLDAERVAAHKIDLEQLTQRLREENFNVSAGEITAANSRFRVKPFGEFTDLKSFEEIILNQQGVKLKDIASITLQQPERQEGRHLDQDYAIGLDILRQSSANMVEVASNVLKAIENAENDPAFQGIKLFVMDNQADGITQSLKDISFSGLIGFVFSIIVLYLFLRDIATTLIVALAVPFALAITLASMFFLGVSLNILSMMGLMLAIGMLVDNAVVVTESIFRYQAQYPDDNRKAVIHGVKEVGVAVFAGTLTTAIVFLPNIIGEKVSFTIFLSHVAITIVIALAASLFIALTIIPLLLIKLNISSKQSASPIINRLTDRYEGCLRWMIARPYWATFIALLTLVSIAIPAVFVKKDNFSDDTKRRLFLPYNIDSQYSIERIEKEVDKMEAFLYDNKEFLNIESVYSFYNNNRAESTILLTEGDKVTRSVTEIRKFIEENMPELAIGRPSFDRNRGQQEAIKVFVSGESTEVLRGLSEDVERLIRSIDGVVEARSEAASKDREFRIIVDRIKAQNIGMDPARIANLIAVAMRGQPLRSFRGKDNEIEVMLEYGDQYERSVSDLKFLQLPLPNGEQIPLSAVARFEVKQAANSIRRMDRRTSIGVVASLDDGFTLDEAKKEIEKVMKSLALPDGYQWTLGRAFDQEAQNDNIMVFNMLLAVMMIFVVMAALFESLLFPLAVISSIIYAVVGVYWFFFITGTQLSIMAFIGILVLMGVVVNNGIVLIDHINHLRKQGYSREQAIIQGGRDRLRPILMTVATTILGLIPLSMGDTTIGGGANSPSYYPMARAVIGGLAFSTIVSLLILPSIYIGLDNLRAGWQNLCRQASERAEQWIRLKKTN
ncbi:MAG: efflux RND transporter permease subunit [Gammaproteobacteria bacterium]|nr:efflux RND transporter permease subunit [Gammaproteobacteria bacterium]